MLSRMTEISTNLSDFKAAEIVILIIFPFNEPVESMRKIWFNYFKADGSGLLQT